MGKENSESVKITWLMWRMDVLVSSE